MFEREGFRIDKLRVTNIKNVDCHRGDTWHFLFGSICRVDTVIR